jgi:5-methylcytosine-specific restriction enzyme A
VRRWNDFHFVHLSLNQGTTSVRDEFGPRARGILQNRSDLIRKRIADYAEALPATSIELGSDARLPGDYAAGHALGVSYDLPTLPEESILRRDLQTIVRAYRADVSRGH